MDDKVRETRLRRAAKRQGLELQKSRRRDPRALDYGKWWIANPFMSNAIILGGEWGVSIDEVEDFLTNRDGP